MSKVLDISSVKTQVAPDLLKALTILSDTTVRSVAQDLLKALVILSDTTVRSAVDQEDLNPSWKSEKRPLNMIIKIY